VIFLLVLGKSTKAVAVYTRCISVYILLRMIWIKCI